MVESMNIRMVAGELILDASSGSEKGKVVIGCASNKNGV